ncbi:hypothetical protein [Pseudonocardia sp. T1-2H]|uniref:hypothetical protein n=1 Tax=Pseudonocardia sp. T1-2H TaxID=3128899 RepID=UPI0031013B3A
MKHLPVLPDEDTRRIGTGPAIAISMAFLVLVLVVASVATAGPDPQEVTRPLQGAVATTATSAAATVDAPAVPLFPVHGTEQPGDKVRLKEGVASWNQETQTWTFCPNGWTDLACGS